MKSTRWILTLVISLILVKSGLSQDTAVDSLVLSAHGINGLSDLLCDSRGLLYLNDPDGGLYRYNGNSFDPVSYRKADSLQEAKYLRHITKDEDGAFYALTSANKLLTFFENGTVHGIRGIEEEDFVQILIDKKKRKWFFGQRTWVLDGDNLQEVPEFSLNGLELLNVRKSDTTFAAICSNSFVFFDLMKTEALQVPLSRELCTVCEGFYRISQDTLLLVSKLHSGTSSANVYYFNIRNGRTDAALPDSELSWGSVFDGFEKGTLLVSTYSGLYVAEPDYDLETTPVSESLPLVSHLLVDNYHTIWASNGSALYKISRKRFNSKVLPFEEYQLPWFFCLTGQIDAHGDIWMGSKNGMISFFDPFTGRHFTRQFPDPYPYKGKSYLGKQSYIVNYSVSEESDTTYWFEKPPVLRDLAIASSGQMYLAGWKTVYYFNPDDDYFIDVFSAENDEELVKVIPLDTDSILIFTTNRAVMIDRFDRISWETRDFGSFFRDAGYIDLKNQNEIGSYLRSGDLLYLRLLNRIISLDLTGGECMGVYSMESKTAENEYVRGNICKGENNQAWFCFRDTLYSVENKKLVQMISLPPIKEGKEADYQEVLCSDGKLWISTNRNLMVADPFLDTAYSIHNDQLTDIFSLVEGREGYLWRINTRTVQLINKKEETLVSYSVRSGINHRSVLTHRTGSHIIVTNGLEMLRFDERSFRENPVTLASIARMAVNQEALCLEEQLAGDSVLHLAYDSERLSFKLVSGDPASASSAVFMYRMVNFDKDWVYSGRGGEISYTSLPAGAYTFEYSTQNRQGEWSVPAQLKIKIPPPWWETKIAFAAYFFFLVFVVVLYTGIRERKLKEDKRKLEQAVRERTAEIEKQKEEIEIQHDLISAQKKNLTDSINYASKIQAALIPGKEIINHLVPDNFILYRPRDIVSGDFYWAEKKNGQVVLVGADCTGHGVPGSLLSMLGMTYLEDIVKTEGITSPAKIMNRLRDRMVMALKQSGKASQMKDGIDMVVISISEGGEEVRFAGARNPVYIIRENQLEEIKGDSFSVGYSDNMRPFTEHKREMGKGDLIYLFSDGYADQFGGTKEKKFMYSQFRELLFSLKERTMDEQLLILESVFNEWKGDIEQIDDVLVIGVRI